MTDARISRRLLLWAVALAMLISVSAWPHAGEAAAEAEPDRDQLSRWIDREARPLRSLDPAAGHGDLRPLRGIVGRASVVGIGESTHGSHEQFQVKHRMVRYLVEELGFRTIALEDDFGSGVLLDRYVTTGDGDLRELTARMSSPFWATEETVSLLEWLRAYNESHDHDVRVLGTDLLWLRQTSFDQLTEHVRAVAPERLEELAALLEPVRIRTTEVEQFGWYFQLTEADKQSLIDAARRIEPFIDTLPAGDDSLRREYAAQHARAIHGWYASNAQTTGFRDFRERFIADSIEWWRHIVGGRLVYWAANVHTAAADELTWRAPGEQQTGMMAGGHLEARLGDAYVSIATFFDHGEISSNYMDPASHEIGTPAEGLLEATLGRAELDNYLLNLSAHGAPAAVDDWLAGPSSMRVILPSYTEGNDSSAFAMAVPALEQSFDALVFFRTTTPTHLLDHDG